MGLHRQHRRWTPRSFPDRPVGSVKDEGSVDGDGSEQIDVSVDSPREDSHLPSALGGGQGCHGVPRVHGGPPPLLGAGLHCFHGPHRLFAPQHTYPPPTLASFPSSTRLSPRSSLRIATGRSVKKSEDFGAFDLHPPRPRLSPSTSAPFQGPSCSFT